MNYTLHKLPEGFIITSDEEIREGDIFKFPDDTLERASRDLDGRGVLKVIAQESNIIFSALKEKEQKKIGWFDVTTLGRKYASQYAYPPELIYMNRKQGYVSGFQKAQELLSDRKFTEEHLLLIRNKLVNDLPTGEVSTWDFIQAISKYTKWFDDYIQFLSQSQSWPVELEIDYDNPVEYKSETGSDAWKVVPKLTDGKVKIVRLL